MKRFEILALAFISLVSGACSSAGTAERVDADADLAYCNEKVHVALSHLPADTTVMPRNIEGTAHTWACRPVCAQEWCSGFWPGVLWYDYEYSKDPEVRAAAEKATVSLAPILSQPVFDHDLGFLIYCSYGNAYRLTGDDAYRSAIVSAADSLATLFNPTAGTLLAWPRHVADYGGHNTIMDTMMNLEMLFFAAKHGGNPYCYDIAVRHAETTMKHHFRPDGSCYHVAVYDLDDGHFMRGCTHQGYADSSMWARGQAWAIYGYTVVYRETRDRRFLDFACKVADVYLDRLPEDGVPVWDFDDPRGLDAPRDASAACVVASALLELEGYADAVHAKRYHDASRHMLASLASDSYRSGDTNDAFLLHSTGHHPAGSEIDASIVYADYYYIEALNRLRQAEKNGKYIAQR